MTKQIGVLQERDSIRRRHIPREQTDIHYAHNL